MLTLKTRYALALLHDIYQPSFRYSDKYNFPSTELVYTLEQLQAAGLVTHPSGAAPGKLSAYLFTKPYMEITLLDVLSALGEGLCFNHKTDIYFYEHYGCLARKLGVVNHMTRLYLSEFRIASFPIEGPGVLKKENRS